LDVALALAPADHLTKRSSKQSVTRQSHHVAQHAKAKLEHLQSLPATSHKWTCGIDVTENNLLLSNQRTKGMGKTLNSGYTQLLPDGADHMEWSITASIPTSISGDYSPPPNVTGLDAGLYFTDAEFEESLAYANANGHGASAELNIGADANNHAGASADNHIGAAPNAAAKSDASAKANLGLPTSSQVALAWHSDLDSTPVANTESLSDAILAADDEGSSHSGSLDVGHSPTSFDAASFYLADTTSSASVPTHSTSKVVPTASHAADVFLLLETDSTHESNSGDDAVSHAEGRPAQSIAESKNEDDSGAESPTTSQIDNPTPSHITLPHSYLYGSADFHYVDATWLSGSDDMMDTDNV
jgi:hypothetical protein